MTSPFQSLLKWRYVNIQLQLQITIRIVPDAIVSFASYTTRTINGQSSLDMKVVRPSSLLTTYDR